jgi:hypothetical protein
MSGTPDIFSICRALLVLILSQVVAFTDSVHIVSAGEPPALHAYLRQIAVNYVRSGKPLDTPERSVGSGCPCVSAGHAQHEYTSATARVSVFRLLDSRLKR